MRKQKLEVPQNAVAIAFMPSVISFMFAVVLAFTNLGFAQSAPPLATVSVETKTLGREIPRDFVGFSLEVSTGGQGLAAFKAKQPGGSSGKMTKEGQYALGRPGNPNTGFFHFMRDLGPGILRLGGNSQDNSCWDLQQAPHPDACEAALNAGDLKLFSTAAEESGWRLILGVNLKQNSPSWALKEITDGLAREIKPQQIFGLEIGNEPDLFARSGLPSPSYSPEDHVKAFLAYFHAFQENSAAKRYAALGPATCCAWRNARDLGAFIDGVGAKNLKLVTVHNYSRTTCGGKTVSIAQLLDPALMNHFNQQAQPLVAAAESRGVPIAMAETNSASCGGMPGVSNAFAATVWGLDYMFSLAQDGFRSVNFHMSYRPGGGSSYNPIDTFGGQSGSGAWRYRNVAEPLYYAMYLFAHNASGKHLAPASISTGANVRAYAVSAAGEVRVRVSAPMGKASLLLLQAPSLSSTAPGVSYGGVQFDSGGRLPAPHSASVERGGQGDYDFHLPNSSAAVLTIDTAHGGA
ncbi:MAG: hypothetical protein ACRD1I_06115 [Terriglobia bacterium]